MRNRVTRWAVLTCALGVIAGCAEAADEETPEEAPDAADEQATEEAPDTEEGTAAHLEPGNYRVECYVKTDGVWHTDSMLVDLTVTEERSGAPEPDADFEVTVTNDGLGIDGEVEAGERTFAVEFAEQRLHGNALWHDVHVARVDDDTDLDELAAWMNWANPEGLEDPAPAVFIGGALMMPEGSTAYVTVDLEPGECAFIAEVDDPQDKDMLETVTVP